MNEAEKLRKKNQNLRNEISRLNRKLQTIEKVHKKDVGELKAQIRREEENVKSLREQVESLES